MSHFSDKPKGNETYLTEDFVAWFIDLFKKLMAKNKDDDISRDSTIRKMLASGLKKRCTAVRSFKKAKVAASMKKGGKATTAKKAKVVATKKKGKLT